MQADARTVESPDGYSWWFRDGEDDHLALGGHETALGPYFESLNDKYKTFINVGAHVGTWAIRGGAWADLVYAVEANPKTFDVLRENIELNKWQHKNVVPVLLAAWDDNSTEVDFIDAQDKETGGSTRLTVKPGGMYTDTLDNVFGILPIDTSWRPTVGLISMDVEGAEAHVLRGAAGIIDQDRPNLLIEVHFAELGHPGVDEDLREQLEEFLNSHNYHVDEIQLSPSAVYWLCQPEELMPDLSYLEEV